MDPLELVKLAQACEKAGWFPKYEDVHLSVVCAILGQRISFARARKIRIALIKALAGIEEKDELKRLQAVDYSKIGCDKTQEARVKGYLDNPELYPNIKGIGPWTVKSVLLITRGKGWESVWLSEDSYIAKNLKSLKVEEKDKGGLVSLLLWRLKPSGLKAIKEGKEIGREHLL